MEKNIILFIEKLTGGGAERVVSNLSLNFPENIHTHIVLHHPYDEGSSYEYGGKLTDLQPPSILKNILKWKLLYVYWAYKLLKIKKRENIDMIISFIDISNLINICANLIFRHESKVVISVRNYPSKRKEDLLKAFTKLFYHRADHIVAISEGVKYDLIENFDISEENITTIYNPCNADKIVKLSKEKISDADFLSLLDDGGTIIINVASFKDSGQKGQWHLIRAFKKVREDVKDAKLVFIGTGELKQKMIKLSVNLGMKDDVLFLGWKQNPFKFMSRSDIFILSSLFEGFGNVITEAMACGLPVVSTDCPAGPREILAPDTNVKRTLKNHIEYAEYGVLTPVCDGIYYDGDQPLTKEENLLAESITRVLKDKELRKHYEKRSKERVRDFEPDNIINRWIELIYDIG